MVQLLWKILREEEGATALEYAILVVLIAIVFSIGALVFGNALQSLFSSMGDSVNTWQGPGSLPNP